MAMYLGSTRVIGLRAGVNVVDRAYVGSNTVFLGALEQFLVRLTTPPTTARIAAYSALIEALVDAGVWTKLDALYIYAAADQATALTNLVSSSYGSTAVNSPGFTADLGFAGNGSSSYIDTNFTPSTAGGNFVQNSAHYSAWVLTSRAGATKAAIGTADGTKRSYMYNYYTDNNFYGLLNDDTTGAIAGSGSAGLFAVDRALAATRNAYKNGGSIGARSATSTGLPAYPFFVGAFNSDGTPGVYSNDRIAFASIGGSLGAAGHLSLYNAVHGYLASVGAI